MLPLLQNTRAAKAVLELVLGKKSERLGCQDGGTADGWIQVTSSKSHRNETHCIMLVRDCKMVMEGEASCCITFYKHQALWCILVP